MSDRRRNGREGNTSRCGSDFRSVRSRPRDERMAELAEANDVTASGLRRATHNLTAPTVHGCCASHLEPLCCRKCLGIQALRVHTSRLVHEPDGSRDLTLFDRRRHFALTTRNSVYLGGVHSSLGKEHQNVAHRLIAHRSIEPLHVVHRVALPSNGALRSSSRDFHSESRILREGESGFLLSQVGAERLDGDNAVLLASRPSPERVLEVLRGDFTEIAPSELLGPLREVRPQVLPISLRSSLGAEVREEARDGRNLDQDDLSLQLVRRLGLRQVSSRISSEQRELGVRLSFARNVESHGIGHAVDHFFEDPDGGPVKLAVSAPARPFAGPLRHSEPFDPDSVQSPYKPTRRDGQLKRWCLKLLY